MTRRIFWTSSLSNCSLKRECTSNEKYNRPQVVDVSLARAKFDQRRRASDLHHQAQAKQVPRNQTVEEVVQMHKGTLGYIMITEKGPYFLPRSVRRNTTRRTKYPFTMRVNGRRRPCIAYTLQHSQTRLIGPHCRCLR